MPQYAVLPVVSDVGFRATHASSVLQKAGAGQSRRIAVVLDHGFGGSANTNTRLDELSAEKRILSQTLR
jgi:hypothetical protein